MQHSYAFFRRKSIRTILIVAGSMTTAFLLGTRTAGDVQPVVQPTNAGGSTVAGDYNGNGVLDVEDATIALEVAMGYRPATPPMLAADFNHDLKIGLSDVLGILDILQQSPAQPQGNL